MKITSLAIGLTFLTASAVYAQDNSGADATATTTTAAADIDEQVDAILARQEEAQPYHYVQIIRGVWVKRPVKLRFSSLDREADMADVWARNRNLAQAALDDLAREDRLRQAQLSLMSTEEIERLEAEEAEAKLTAAQGRAIDALAQFNGNVSDEEYLATAANIEQFMKGSADAQRRAELASELVRSNARYIARQAEQIEDRMTVVADADKADKSPQAVMIGRQVAAANAQLQALREAEAARRAALAELDKQSKIDALRRILNMPEVANASDEDLVPAGEKTPN